MGGASLQSGRKGVTAGARFHKQSTAVVQCANPFKIKRKENFQVKKLAVLNLVLVFGLLFSSVALAADDIQGTAYDYFNGGTKNMAANVLYDNLNDGDTSNDPYIVSVRSKEDHDKGHIPGDHWVDAKAFFSQANLDLLPTDKPIVVYCYTGQTASQIVSVLRMMGYDAYNLLFGFGSWTMNPDAGSKWFDETKSGFDYPTETTTNEATETYALPTPLADTIQATADAYFSGGTKNISADALYDNLNDGDTSNDPFILSQRSAEDYAKGHIPGAVNIPTSELFIAANLAKLPPDKQIVVYCYTGQTASQVVSALRLLGYDAYNLLFGMQAWTMDKDVRVKYFNPETASFDYPFEGTAAAGEAVAAPEATPVTMPETGGLPFPVEGVLVGFGTLTAAAGLYLRRRKAA
jgi:rhodanese-related sulfurtransferase